MLLTTGAGFGYPTVPLCVLSWAAGTTDVFIRELEREGVRARFMDKDLRVAVCEVDRQVDRFSLVSCFSAMLLGTSEWLETSSDATAKTEDSTAQVMLGKSSDPIVKEDSSGGSPGAAGSEFLKAQPEQNPWKQASDGPQECSSEKEISNQKSCRETSRTFRLLPQKRGEEINMSHINAALAEMFSSEGVGDEAERVLASRDSWRISTLRETNYRKGHCPHKFKSPEVVKSVPYRLEDVIGPARMNALPDIRCVLVIVRSLIPFPATIVTNPFPSCPTLHCKPSCPLLVRI